MSNHELDKQVYWFGMLAVVVIVALDRMSSQPPSVRVTWLAEKSA